MTKKVLAICQSQHQLEKALYIQKILTIDLDIACTNYQPNHLYLESIKHIKVYASFKKLIHKIDDYEKFLFFSMVPSAQIFNFIKRIKKSKKIIIAVQETHQLAMNFGVINNLIFSADIIFAASDLEKDYLEKLHPGSEIHSVGWLFQNKYHRFVHSLYTGNVLAKNCAYALIIFAAPTYITTSSEESFQARKHILEFIKKKYIDLNLVVKLHPLEDKRLFKKYAQQNCIYDLSFAPQDQSLWELGQNSSVIVASDKTQAFIDLAIEDHEFILYRLGKENFISKYFYKYVDAEEVNEIFFYSLPKNKNHIRLFKKIYCKAEPDAEINFFSILDNANEIVNKMNDLEMAAWSHIYDSGKSFKSSIEKSECSMTKNLKEFFGPSGSMNLKDLAEQLQSVSLRTAIILAIMREIIKRNDIQKKIVTDFTETFFSPHIIQYFAIDSMRFELYLQKENIECHISQDSRALLEKTKLLLARKSKFLKKLLALRLYLKNTDSIVLKRLAYYFEDTLLLVLYYLKN